jgi:hypothetical protein
VVQIHYYADFVYFRSKVISIIVDRFASLVQGTESMYIMCKNQGMLSIHMFAVHCRNRTNDTNTIYRQTAKVFFLNFARDNI